MVKRMRLFLLFAAVTLTSALKAQNASEAKPAPEQLQLIVDTSESLAARSLTVQEPSNFSEGKKALFIPLLAGYLINKGIAGIQQLIDDRKNRYTAQYSFAERDHYFYNQISTSAIDPVGLQFNGFKVVRFVKRHDRQPDTVFMAKFILDTTADLMDEMMNNGIFRLRLDSIMILKSKVKAPKNVERLNMDFEINFTTSYRGDDGQIHSDDPIGKFVFTLRNAPLYNADNPQSVKYYDSLTRTKPPLVGESFMVPRSSGFYKTKNGLIKSCYGQGLYSINVSVKETSKTKFVDKVIVFTSDPALNVGSQVLQKRYGSGAAALPASSGKTSKK